MQYVVMDLEWNTAYCKKFGCFFNEIIEIGAVKLDENFNIKDSASVIVKPQIGKKLRGRVKDLTHITNEDISSGISFEEAVKGFSEWLGDEENTFLTWGDGDIRVFSKNYEYFFNIDALPFIDNYADAQKYCQSFIDAPSGQQIGLASACEKLGVNPEDFSHHRALDDSLMTVECIKKVYDSAKLQKYIRKCDTAFYKKLSFKPYVIKDLNDPDIDRSKLKCVCDTCGGKVVKKKKWGFVNNSFRAEFYCPNCDKNFRVSVRYKRYFDRVEAKKTFSDIAQKDRHRSKQKEKV
ncbi:MAG: exonuclease domain-containing protein [Ruminococcus sp.]|nr:exonuclease domain-containing protein [Ruminococcus sp.]